MRTYYIDDERKFRCEIENGKFSGDLIFDMTNGSFYGNMPANMPKYTWFWYVMDFIKICAKMYKPAPSLSHDLD